MRSGMSKLAVIALAGLGLLATGFFLGGEIEFYAEPDELVISGWNGEKPPDAQLFRDVREGLQNFRKIEVPVGAGDQRLRENPHTGLIQTAWFPVHKGESEQKVQIAVWGSLYRIDVWSRSLFTGKLGKTLHSRAAERKIQETIEALRHSRSAAVNSGATLGLTAPQKTNYATETSSSSTRGSAAGR